MPEWEDEIKRRLGDLKLEPTREAEIVEELAQHLDDRYSELRSGGADEDDAYRSALAELSESDLLARELRRVERSVKNEPVVLGAGRSNMIADLWQDLRYAARSLRKHAALSIAVIATLTLGIGISAGAFAFCNAEFLRPQVDKDFSSYLVVYSAYTGDPLRPSHPGATTLEDYIAFRDRAKSLSNLAASAQFDPLFGHEDQAEVRARLVTSNFFSVFDLEQPLIGRLLQAEDCSAANPVVVLSEQLWRSRLAADPQIVGKVVHFNNQPVTVVGVTPAKFAGMVNGARAWFPYTLETYLKGGDNLLRPGEAAWLDVAGRLNPGFSHNDAAAELRLIASQQDSLHPNRMTTLTVTDGSWIQQPEWRDTIILGLAVILGVLMIFVLIVCVNVTTLLLSRAVGVARDVSIVRLGGPVDPMLYLPWNPNSPAHPYVRFSGDGTGLGRVVPAAIREMDPELSVTAGTIQSLREERMENLGRNTRLVVFLCGMAVILAVIGIYGVVTFAVSQRTKEIGIRIALGAGKKDVYGAILGPSSRPVAVGLLLGLSVTITTFFAVASLEPLRHMNIRDPITYAIATVLLAGVALAAMLIAARRATKVDPMAALREE